jgi:hypothetical protein
MADGALKEFFVSLGLDSDAASWASAITMVDGFEKLLGQARRRACSRSARSSRHSVVETGKYGSELDDTSKKTGFATQALEEYTYAAKLAGGSSEIACLGGDAPGSEDGRGEERQRRGERRHSQRLGVRVFE